VVAGSVLLLVATGLFAGGAGSLWAGQAKRLNAYVTSRSVAYTTTGRALMSETISVPGAGLDQLGRRIVGKVRVRVTATKPATAIFVGLAKARDARRYLDGVQHTTIRNVGTAGAGVTTKGTRVPAIPDSVPIWTVSSVGLGTQTIVTTVTRGAWRIVVMNPDASAGLAVRADVGATAPGLPWVAGGLLAAGVLASTGAALLIVIAVRRSSAISPWMADPAN
jgi:hypothetical protein